MANSQKHMINAQNHMTNKTELRHCYTKQWLFNIDTLTEHFPKAPRRSKMHAGINLLLRSKRYEAREMPNSVTFSSKTYSNNNIKRHQHRITSIF